MKFWMLVNAVLLATNVVIYLRLVRFRRQMRSHVHKLGRMLQGIEKIK
jgi:hypothetical protein